MKKFLTLSLLALLALTSCKKEESNVIDKDFKRVDILPIEISESKDAPEKIGYDLIWADEFNYTGAPDSSKWSYEVGTGNGGWGNNELQFYTNRLENSSVQDGSLKITAKKENYSGSEYTSARLVSKNKGDFKYGYIEFSAKLPGGIGTWPALWMMPTDSVYGGWPNSGEIDIMEYRGSRKDRMFSTVHTKNRHGSGITSGEKYFAGLEDNFNTYALEWTEDKMIFFFNGQQIHQYTNPNRTLNPENDWPFDQEFFLIMNVAMGGTLGGTVDTNFTESSMYVDYVRVYQKNLEDIDVLEPEMVEITNTSSSSSTITINWKEAKDEFGVKQYDVVINGKQVGATTKTSYTINDLDPNTEYTIQVLAVDRGNNFSVSLPSKVKTTDVLRAPGVIEVEQFVKGENCYTLNNPKGGISVDLSNVNNNCGYIVCEVYAKEGTYNLVINGMVPRFNNGLYVYTEGNENTKELINLPANAGKYVDIETEVTLSLKEGINYIVIECYSESIGKVITIDNITLK